MGSIFFGAPPPPAGGGLADTPWSTYTPALINTTSGATTLGTGATASGAWTRAGRSIVGGATIVLGTAPSLGTAGGELHITLPVSPKAGDGIIIGSGWVFRNSVSELRLATLEMPLSTSNAALRTVGVAQRSTTDIPWTWAVDDRIHVRFTYEAAAVA